MPTWPELASPACKEVRVAVWALIATTTGLPVLFVTIMAMNFHLGRPGPFWDMMARLGWDLCVLGIGVAGGVFSNDEAHHRWGQAAYIVAAGVAAIDMVLGGIIVYYMSMNNPAPVWLGRLALFLGTCAVALPAALTFLKRDLGIAD